MDREATRVETMYPRLSGNGYGREEWVVGQKRLNPDRKPDIVTHILLKENNTVLITYRDFGTEWIFNHVEKVEFRDANYETNKQTGLVNTSELKKGLNQDAMPRR